MPRPQRFQKDNPQSLRRGGNAPTFTDEQMQLVACFATAIMQGGHGIYLKANAEGNSVRVKIYTDDDTYQDTIYNQEDVSYLLHDYATQLKVLPIFQALVGGVHAAPTAPAPKALRDPKG